MFGDATGGRLKEKKHRQEDHATRCWIIWQADHRKDETEEGQDSKNV